MTAAFATLRSWTMTESDATITVALATRDHDKAALVGALLSQVGGAPFRLDTGLWQEVGADATGRNSAEAIALVDRFTGGAR